MEVNVKSDLVKPINEASTEIYLNIPLPQTELQGLPPADHFTHVGSTPLLDLNYPLSKRKKSYQ